MTGPKPSSPPGSVLAFTHGDRVAAEQLHRTLVALRDHLDDPTLRRRIGDVLDGRMTLRELSRDPLMLAEMGRGMERFAQQWAEMSPAERADLARQGQRDTDELRDQLGMGPERDPAPIGEFGPATTDPA